MPDPMIPRHLLRQTPEPRYLVADDLSLTITAGETAITLQRSDLKRLQAFFDRFDLDSKEPGHANA